LHFDGMQVRVVPTGIATVTLNAIHGASPNDAWAVGTQSTVLHWDGAAWTAVPNVGSGELLAVLALKPEEAWIGGTKKLGRVTGAGFEPAAVALPKYSLIRDIGGVAPDDVWAVGSDGRIGFVTHYDGSSWSPLQVLKHDDKDAALIDVVARARDDVWIDTYADVTWHWDGATWSAVPRATNPAAPAAAPQPPRFDGFQLGETTWMVGPGGGWKYQSVR